MASMASPAGVVAGQAGVFGCRDAVNGAGAPPSLSNAGGESTWVELPIVAVNLAAKAISQDICHGKNVERRQGKTVRGHEVPCMFCPQLNHEAMGASSGVGEETDNRLLVILAQAYVMVAEHGWKEGLNSQTNGIG